MPKPPPRVGVKNSKPDAAIPVAPPMKSKEPPIVEAKESKNPKAIAKTPSSMSKKMPKKEC